MKKWPKRKSGIGKFWKRLYNKAFRRWKDGHQRGLRCARSNVDYKGD